MPILAEQTPRRRNRLLSAEKHRFKAWQDVAGPVAIGLKRMGRPPLPSWWRWRPRSPILLGRCAKPIRHSGVKDRNVFGNTLRRVGRCAIWNEKARLDQIAVGVHADRVDSGQQRPLPEQVLLGRDHLSCLMQLTRVVCIARQPLGAKEPNQTTVAEVLVVNAAPTIGREDHVAVNDGILDNVDSDILRFASPRPTHGGTRVAGRLSGLSKENIQ